MQLRVEDGLAMSRVDDIICDNQNIIWIKSSRGLQFWDGQKVQAFPDSILEVGTQFHMYPHYEEGIIISMPGLVRQFTYEGLKKKTIYSNIPLDDFIPITINTEKQVAFLIHPDSILYYQDGAQISDFIKKHTISNSSGVRQYTFQEVDYIIDFNSRKSFVNNTGLFEKVNEKLFVNGIRNTVLLNSEDVIYSSKEGLHFINDSHESSYPYPDKMKANYYSAILKISDRKLLVGIDNMLGEFDLIDKKWKSFYKNTDQNDLLQTGYFDKLIFDKYNNIWAITVNEGLLKIYNNDSFNYYGSSDKKLNFVKNIVADESNNRVIAAVLNGGIMIYDTIGNLSHHLNANNTNGLVKSVTGIYQISEDQYIFNNHRDSMIYGLSFQNNHPAITPLAAKKEAYVYYQDAIQIDQNSSLLLFNTLYHLQHFPFELSPLLLYHSTKSCMVLDGEVIWIGCIDGILKYNLEESDNYQFYEFPGEGYVRSISKWKDNNLVIGTDRGLSIFDKENSKLSFVDEGCIYCLLSDDEFNIWAGTGSGIKKFDQDLHKTQYSQFDGLQNNEFNTNACAKSESGKLYFGGLNGITSFDPKAVTNKEHVADFYIKALKEGNTNLITNASLGKISDIHLDHNENNLSISVGTIGKFESSSYNYQYYVEGTSSNWVDAQHQTQYNFNLSPGKYKFYFSASNAFDPNATLANPINISIENPWWKQWWFYLTVLLSLIGVTTYFIKAKERQKYLKKKFEWDLEYQRQEDRIKMSKELHDNIGSRLTFLVSSVDNIKKAVQSNSSQALSRIDDVAEFGKDTIEDLRSMMWVLSVKSISVQDLQLKILDYLNIAKNTYRNIDFQYEGPQLDLEHKLDSKLSQNIFRVIQEGIHNSIKHADPTTISLRLSFENHVIKVSIVDNGYGFDMERTMRGNGLKNMKSRLSEHQSDIQITSKIDHGTSLYFEVNTIT